MSDEIKWAQRDRKIAQRSKTMRVTGRSVFTIVAARHKRDKQIKEDHANRLRPE